MCTTRPKFVTRLWAAILPLCLAAQQSDTPTIRTDVPLVLLPATVTDNKGAFINGLTADDFHVSDEGVRQKIRLDTADTVLAPISLIVAIQSSSISAAAVAKIREVGSLIRPLVAGDRGQVAVIAYDREVRVIEPFTGDASRIADAFAHIEARTPRSGVLLDAVAEGIEMLKARPANNRRVLVFLGESRDRGSKTPMATVVEAAQRFNIAIYPITYSPQKTAWTAAPGDAPPPPGAPNYIEGFGELFRFGKPDAADVLSRNSGGRQFAFVRQAALEEALTSAGEELHNQYLISFAPLESIGNRYRRVQVKVPSLPKAIVRARPGYWP